jgi:hypothetical protein
MNAVLKKGPKKFFHRVAACSGVSRVVPEDPPGTRVKDAPQ